MRKLRRILHLIVPAVGMALVIGAVVVDQQIVHRAVRVLACRLEKIVAAAVHQLDFRRTVAHGNGASIGDCGGIGNVHNTDALLTHGQQRDRLAWHDRWTRTRVVVLPKR